MDKSQLYFEGSWSILSTIGLVNVINGLTVISVIGVSPIAIVPVVISAAAAIANGLCYYAFYAHYSQTNTIVAAAFADIFWLIQEAGLSFYSYMILRRLLQGRARLVFLSLFWSIIAMMAALRMAILTCHVKYIKDGDPSMNETISQLHIGYFALIAVVEIISTYFLLHIFAPAKEESRILGHYGLFDYLSRGTLIRLASLAVIGVSRAITYSFQRGQNASSFSGEIDRFVYALECMFPVVMYIDVLASRVAAAGQGYTSSGNPRNSRQGNDFNLNSVHTEVQVEEIVPGRSSCENMVCRIEDVDMPAKGYNTTPKLDRDSASLHRQDMAIHKTVEFGIAISKS